MSRRQIADLIISSNAVFTGLTNEPIAASIAIKDNKILAVGTKDEIVAFQGDKTRVYDFKDQLVMPGFHDFHVHVFPGSLQIDSVSLLGTKSEQEAVQLTYEFAKKRPNDPWIIGFSWDHGNWPNKQLPTKATLDKLFPDRPVMLTHIELHYAWVNSKALEIVGINRDTVDPPFGRIERDEHGEPTGILYENAMDLILKEAFSFTKERKTEMLKQFFKLTSRYGITSVSDVYAPSSDYLDDHELYKELDEAGELKTRIHFYPALTNDLTKVKQQRETYQSNMLQLAGLKSFIDGVITGYTAYMHEPYSDRLNTKGKPAMEPELFKEMVINADREGFSIRTHAIGDAAVQLTLDAYEAARKANGDMKTRHAIEHIEVIQPDDIQRFHELNVIASMQPHHLALIDQSVYLSRLGEKRHQLTFMINSLKKAGARLAFGSDFPVTEINPFLEIYRAVTRVDFSGKAVWNSEEKISLSETLKAYTYGPAYGAFRENELGTLEAGKLADIIVLDRNLFTVPAEEILKTEVTLTILDGKVIYEA